MTDAQHGVTWFSALSSIKSRWLSPHTDLERIESSDPRANETAATRKTSNDGTDRLSRLPPEVLDIILTFLITYHVNPNPKARFEYHAAVHAEFDWVHDSYDWQCGPVKICLPPWVARLCKRWILGQKKPPSPSPAFILIRAKHYPLLQLAATSKNMLHRVEAFSQLKFSRLNPSPVASHIAQHSQSRYRILLILWMQSRCLYCRQTYRRRGKFCNAVAAHPTCETNNVGSIITESQVLLKFFLTDEHLDEAHPARSPYWPVLSVTDDRIWRDGPRPAYLLNEVKRLADIVFIGGLNQERSRRRKLLRSKTIDQMSLREIIDCLPIQVVAAEQHGQLVAADWVQKACALHPEVRSQHARLVLDLSPVNPFA